MTNPRRWNRATPRSPQNAPARDAAGRNRRTCNTIAGFCRQAEPRHIGLVNEAKTRPPWRIPARGVLIPSIIVSQQWAPRPSRSGGRAGFGRNVHHEKRDYRIEPVWADWGAAQDRQARSALYQLCWSHAAGAGSEMATRATLGVSSSATCAGWMSAARAAATITIIRGERRLLRDIFNSCLPKRSHPATMPI